MVAMSDSCMCGTSCAQARKRERFWGKLRQLSGNNASCSALPALDKQQPHHAARRPHRTLRPDSPKLR